MKIREAVKEFSSYDSEREELEVRLDKNESPFPLPDELQADMHQVLERMDLNRYPKPNSEELRRKLAEFHGVKKSNVVAGSGSDQLISYAVELFSGNHVIISPPTFSMYRFYSERAGYEVKEVPLTKEFALNPGGIKDRLDGAATVFLCSPNNPTGNRFDREALLEILETGKPVVLDEAYTEFSGESEIDLISEFDNLIVLRTFSKAFGLAGARVGYAITGEEIASQFLRVKPPYNLSSTSARIAELALDNYDLIQERVDFIVEERERIYDEFTEFAYPSRANFLLMDLDAGDYLGKKGVGVRTFSGELSNMIRVTIGTNGENERFVECLEDYVEQFEPSTKKQINSGDKR